MTLVPLTAILFGGLGHLRRVTSRSSPRRTCYLSCTLWTGKEWSKLALRERRPTARAGYFEAGTAAAEPSAYFTATAFDSTLAAMSSSSALL